MSSGVIFCTLCDDNNVAYILVLNYVFYIATLFCDFIGQWVILKVGKQHF